MEKSVEKIMQEPIFIGYTDQVRKIKNLLLTLSLISLFLVYGRLSIDGGSTILGLKFNGLSNFIIYSLLIILVSFNFIAFLWNSSDTFREWHIRQSGIKNLFNKKNNIRNESLYNWWIEFYNQLSNPGQRLLFSKLITTQQKIADLIENESSVEEPTTRTRTIYDPKFTSLMDDYNTKINDIHSYIKVVEKMDINSLEKSLKNFDSKFKGFCKSQNFRWLLLDLIIPYCLGLFSLCSLINQIIISF